MKKTNNILASLLLLLTATQPATSQFGEGEHQSGNKHMAAHHYTVVCTGNAMPSSVILTYPLYEYRVQDYNFLLKLMPGIESGKEKIFPSRFRETRVKDIPGAVDARMAFGDTELTTRITPLLIGRGADSWQGAVLYEVEAAGGEDVLVELGGGETINLIWGFENSIMKKDSVAPLLQPIIIDGAGMEFIGGKDRLHMGLRTSGSLHGQTVRLKGGKGHILVVYSEAKEDIGRLLAMDPAGEKQKVEAYYANLLEASVLTPERLMNEAFASAIYNLEYSWLEPFGWGECLHHWLALWYMQVTAAAEWIAQGDRSRSSILEHGRGAFENGAIPMFIPNHLKQGMKRRDWGGANTFWVWQVRHYVKMTGDRDFAREVLPMVEDCIRQSLEEYDPDGNMLLAWGLQIGNQEDFVANPWDGAVPTMELYNMCQTMAELCDFTGDEHNASRWESRAEQTLDALYRELWQKDLGRFAYYRDPTGMLMPEGQYQTYLYPAIFGIGDEYDRYSGIRHLRDRLADTAGAVFATNHFPFHIPDFTSTWGMQRGAAQQPWAAMGYAAMGMNELTWKPLLTMARWAQDPRREGSWPETGPEPTPAYFTPPAGLYISTVIEALFGFTRDVPGKYMTLSPSFPEHWPGASLNLPGLKADYSRKKNRLDYRIENSEGLSLKVRWSLPVSEISRCRVNGKEVAHTLEPGINRVILCFDVPDAREARIQIEYRPLEYRLDAPGSLCEGDELDVTLEGARILSLTDRAQVLDRISVTGPGRLSGRISTGLLDPYLKYGKLGQLNFSRRSLFLDCESPGGTGFILPVDLSILPRWEAASKGSTRGPGEKQSLSFMLRNNSGQPFGGRIRVQTGDRTTDLEAKLGARSEAEFRLELPAVTGLNQGENRATVSVPGEAHITFPFRVRDQEKEAVFLTQPLPPEELIADRQWFNLRVMPGYPHIFFTFSPGRIPEPMEALEGISRLEVEDVPGLEFSFKERHFLPLSHLSGRTSCRIPLKKEVYRKVYVLMLALVDNHNMFSDVARITAFSGAAPKYSRTLRYPGDVDYWVSHRNPTSFATFRGKREAPQTLLPLLGKEQSDWKEGTPPAFPQSEWWSGSLPLEFESCVMSLIEIDPGRPVELDHLVVESLGALPAAGIVAVSGELYK